MAAAFQKIRRHAAVQRIVRLDIVAGVVRRAPRHKPDMREAGQFLQVGGTGLHALDDHPVHQTLGQRPGQLVGRLGIKHREIDPLLFVGCLNLDQLVLEPIEIRVFARSDKPDGDLLRLREARLGSPAVIQRGRRVIDRRHDRLHPGEPVGGDKVRLVDDPRYRRGRYFGLTGNVGNEHGGK